LQITPYNTVYTLSDAQLFLGHELSPRWRVNASVDEYVETAVSSAPVVLPNGSQVYERGLGSLVTLAQLGVRHDFSPEDVGGLFLGYSTSFVPFVVDYTKVPPRYLGYATTEGGSLTASWTRAYGRYWRTLLGAGVSVAESPPQDIPATGLVTTPTGNAVLSFNRRYFVAVASAGYVYGSTTPILGYGPTTSGGLFVQGIPYPHGAWTQLAILASASATRSQLLGAGGTLSALDFAVGSVEARLAFNTWLGFVGGYNFRYSTGEGATAFPPLVRHVIFLGLGGYFSDDKSLPTIDSFSAPVIPSG
jgi:hypothetical protein